jgi:hypothetical protein
MMRAWRGQMESKAENSGTGRRSKPCSQLTPHPEIFLELFPASSQPSDPRDTLFFTNTSLSHTPNF